MENYYEENYSLYQCFKSFLNICSQYTCSMDLYEWTRGLQLLVSGSIWWTFDTPVRLVCYTGCGVAFVLCETGIVNFNGTNQQ